MTTTFTTPSTLRAAAHAFLASCDQLAIEAVAGERLIACVRQLADGALDGAGLRAAIGGSAAQTRRASKPADVAVLELRGVLTPDDSIFTLLDFGTNVRRFIALLNQAAADAATKAIVVLVDSPGGLVRLIPEAARAMREVRAKKPVIAAVTGLNASAAYWISANATALEATPSAMVGSIGVFAIRVDVTRQLEKDGIDVLVSSAGKFKVEGLPVVKITDDERKASQALTNEIYEQFASDVALGRGVSPLRVRDGFGEGRLVTATTAAQLGMIDRVALLEDTLRRVLSTPATTPQARALAGQRALEHEVFRLQLDAVIDGAPFVGLLERDRTTPTFNKASLELDTLALKLKLAELG
jgi:signal peptide peptidase SppA